MKKKILKVLGIIFLVLVVIAAGGYIWFKQNFMVHTFDQKNALEFNATGNPVLDSVGKGVSFLTASQNKEGAFVEGVISPSVEFTALAAQALKNVPEEFLQKQDVAYRQKLDGVIAKALDYIKTTGPKEDGGIYSKLPKFSVSVYGTSVSLTALRDLGLPEKDPLIQNAQKYLISCQHDEKGLYKGGFSYGPKGRSDLSNTVYALEALEASGLPKDDPAYKLAVEFINKCQNRSESNDSGMAVTEDGGFFYKPDLSGKRANVTTRDGKKAYASYGAMSYAGLISFLYADVDKTDPRVKSAWKWVQNNYNLAENVNRGQSGLYYYYRIMAKALSKYGERVVVTADGKQHNWAEELAQNIVRQQQSDGSWVNSKASFMEDDKVLVTSFALGVLETCIKENKKFTKNN